MNNIAKTSLIAFGVAAATSAATFFALGNHSEKYVSVAPLESSGNLYTVAQSPEETPTDFVTAAESTVNGVVSIKSFAASRGYQSHGNSSPFNDPFFEFFFGGPQTTPRNQQPQSQPEQVQTGLGSGVILSKDGYIVTNNHVVSGADRLEVTLNDNRNFNAKVIGTDPSTDIALIKIDADDLHVIPIGDSESLRVGEWVLAVGNPFGFTSTVTKGIVSAKGRSISSITRSAPSGIESFIQTDAAVNPGNSGGALVNLNGELVGINTAIYSQTGNFAGYSFAVPTSIVKKVVTDLKQYGAVQRALLGVSFKELSPELIKEKKLDTQLTSGIYVDDVVDRSAAFEAGIKEGDIITAIDNSPTLSGAQLQEAIAKKRPGDKVTITFYRDNKKMSAGATLRNAEGTVSIARAGDITDLGCALNPISEQTKRQLEISSGVQVSGIRDGKFKAAGIKDGFIIISINNTRVRSAEDVETIYKAIMSDRSGEDKAMFITGLYPTGRKGYYAVPLSE